MMTILQDGMESSEGKGESVMSSGKNRLDKKTIRKQQETRLYGMHMMLKITIVILLRMVVMRSPVEKKEAHVFMRENMTITAELKKTG